MSNEDLKSIVAELQSNLAQIEGENQRLMGEIGVAVGAVNAADMALVKTRAEINQGLGNANMIITQSHERVIAAYELQKSIDVTYDRMKNMELANKEIRKCNNTKYYDFSVYRQVRKIVQGIMDNLDFSMINEGVIERSVEKEHLAQPNYWLTPLLIAVCAWRDDERERAERALATAYQLDARKVASFLLVFYLRLRREEAAFKWFDRLIQGKMHGNDRPMVLLFFSMLSDTIEDKITDRARDRVSTYMRKLIADALNSSETTRTEAVQRITNTFRAYSDDFSFPYPQITQHVASAKALQSALALARNNANIIDFISGIMNVDEARRNEYLKSYIDTIVEEPCPDEAAVYDEIERNELIIKHQGDKEKAAEAFAEQMAYREKEFDIINEMMHWVYTIGGRKETNPQMCRNMLVLTRELQQEAGDQYVKTYRMMFDSNSTATVDEYTGPINLGNPTASYGDIEAFYAAKSAEDQSAIKDIGAYVAFGVGVVIILASIFGGAYPFIALGVLAIAFGAALILMYSSQRKRIRLEYEQKTQNAENIFAAIGEEYKALEAVYREADSLSADLENRLASI